MRNFDIFQLAVFVNDPKQAWENRVQLHSDFRITGAGSGKVWVIRKGCYWDKVPITITENEVCVSTDSFAKLLGAFGINLEVVEPGKQISVITLPEQFKFGGHFRVQIIDDMIFALLATGAAYRRIAQDKRVSDSGLCELIWYAEENYGMVIYDREWRKIYSDEILNRKIADVA